MLEAREQRALAQKRLLDTFGSPLISYTMNIPGPVKDSPLIRRSFFFGCARLDEALEEAGYRVLAMEQSLLRTGCQRIYAVDAPADRLKTLCQSIEDSCPLGRLFDMDVLLSSGRKLDRADFGGKERGCIVCGAAGRACASRRAHSLEELESAVLRLMTEHFRAYDRRLIAELAHRCLLDEVHTTPKPGLVDERNSGSHRDMDIDSFHRSAEALKPYWSLCIEAGQNSRSLPARETFRQLRPLGIAAEKAMLEATGGVNTHKCAIFSLGTLCAAVGRLWDPLGPCVDADRLLAECTAMSAETIEEELRAIAEASSPSTAGERLYISCGMKGVRGELAAGLPGVKNTSLPLFRQAMEKGMSRNQAGVYALLGLIALGNDSNMAARSSPDEARSAAAEVRAMLPWPEMEQVEALDDSFIARNLSPGGCADLLAVTYFLYDLEKKYTIQEGI